MIISASRRTDIPALYSDWFLSRLKEGFALVPNPMNPKMISRVPLDAEQITCIVFWSKNPAPMLHSLDRLKDIPFYFQFTLTAYDHTIETALPNNRELIQTFQQLSQMVGKQRVVWRYDPVFFTDYYTLQKHVECFSYLAQQLNGYTDTCMFSFLDNYRKTQLNMKHIAYALPKDEDMYRFTEQAAAIAQENDMALQSCAETVDLSIAGVQAGSCIDKQRIERIVSWPIDAKKDGNQRQTCNCIESVDIGMYHTCTHGCLYCYANSHKERAEKNYRLHHIAAPLLIGSVPADATITDRQTTVSLKKTYQQVFDWDEQ